MINRIIKVLTNKPTDIKGPVFAKKFDEPNKQIQDLEKLLEKANENSRKYIEADIKKIKYGAIGESNVYYELKHSFMPMVCLHNLRLEYKGLVAQIDFVVITTKNIYVIECKNLVGDIVITDKGEFIRYKKNLQGKGSIKEGMYSPIVQNERHINVLKEILKDKLGYKNNLNRIESLVVIANPSTIINKKYAPSNIANKIIRNDQLIQTISNIEKDKKINWVFMQDDMEKIARCLKDYHKDIDIDYINKYCLEEENQEDSEDLVIKNNEMDEKIRYKLRGYRLSVSNRDNLKPYMVFSNDTMEQVISVKPKCIDELMKVKGFGRVKCEKYGEDIISIVNGN